LGKQLESQLTPEGWKSGNPLEIPSYHLGVFLCHIRYFITTHYLHTDSKALAACRWKTIWLLGLP